MKSSSELKPPSSGTYCIYKHCKNTLYKCRGSGLNVKFFRVPKDEAMCRKWIQAIGRQDLLDPSGVIDLKKFHNYRVCSDHFEDDMYYNPIEKSHLLGLAEPIKFEDNMQVLPLDQPSTSFGHQPVYQKRHLEEEDERGAIKKIKILSNIQVTSPDKQVPVPLLSPVETQTSSALSSRTPRKAKLKEKLDTLNAENIRLKAELQAIIRKRDSEPTETDFKVLCDKFLNKELSEIVKAQVDFLKRSEYGRRYSDHFKQFTLTLYFLSPKCYRQLSKTFCLPSKRSLCRFIENIKFSAGINLLIFQLLKLKVSRMQEIDKICVLCLDELSIKTNLFYNYGTDTIIGLEDNGDNRGNQPASAATVVMVRGLKSTWKQPVAYTFSATSYNADEMKILLEKIVVELKSIGLQVVALITDMGSNCIELAKNLGVTPNNTNISLGNEEMFFYFDPPHLIKAVRNNLLNNDFKWDNMTASWKDIEHFYKKDKNCMNKLAPKLTNAHINPTNFERMKVKLATQVVSNTLAAGLETYVKLGALPPRAMGTVEVISRFDKLFDILNSSNQVSQKKMNRAFRGEEYQVGFLSETLDFLDKLIIFNTQKNKKVSVKFLNCFKISINSLIHLWDLVKTKGFEYLLTRRLNQDCVENFFGTVRQQSGNAVNPTPVQFTRAFRKLFILNYTHAESMNCTDDFDILLTELADFSKKNVLNVSHEESSAIFSQGHVEHFKVEGCNYNNISFPEQNAFKYVCGYLISKCLKIHSCSICENFAKQSNKLDESNLFVHYKAYDTSTSTFGSLKTPHESFYEFIYLLEKCFLENVEKNLTKNPGNSLYHKFLLIKFVHPCHNFPIDYLLKLYIRLRIYYLLKTNNAAFKVTPKKNRKLNILLNL